MHRVLRYLAIYTLIISVSSIQHLQAQVMPVGFPVLEEQLRREQLLGMVDSSLSFSVRPLTNNALKRDDIYFETLRAGKASPTSIKYFFNGKGKVQLMPIVWEQQINSNYRYGWNDGSMIPSKGYQTSLSVGVYAEYKWFSIQLRPEFVTAANSQNPGYRGDNQFIWSIWYDLNNHIDLPEYYGNGRYTKLFPGQSSIRFNYQSLSLGVSTENIWWGPGRQNSLLMSNNAPGFFHLTLNTTRPIQTGIGSFEGQLIAGKLPSTGYTPAPMDEMQFVNEYYNPKPDDWRYISGIVLAYQPKWLSGLSIGLTRSFIVYSENLGGGLKGYLPLLGPGSKSAFNDPDKMQGREDRMNRDVYASIFARWVMPKGNAEIYFEYGRTDPPWNQRDLLVELDHSRAYVVGFRKLIPLQTPNSDMIQVEVEGTQLEKTRTQNVRNSPSWYTDYRVRDGYTNMGQVLGAGIGPGSNMQSVGISWLRGLKQLGLQAERLTNNNDLFYRAYRDVRRPWVDLGIAALGTWDFNKFIVSGKLRYSNAFNYLNQLQDSNEGFWAFERMDKSNWHFRTSVIYRF
ncbi:capsule assembly Wzi family protein [Parapedobacter koreensis]|uniref:Capsule assembly protein Wzi n=1 Tax=Parapedobacter koreensis TaxID=332977 RepID=A0A1H7RG01_9SPHI|nr:capsule assembly Wzi family protein [Parapedobacter koreensis]SEL59181.1 Capsule assembly protein Wzi [Parapedobacter koreensis]